MTRRQAEEMAKKSLRYGYFHDTKNFKVWVRCTHCTRSIHADDSSSRPEPARIDALEVALVTHLLEVDP